MLLQRLTEYADQIGIPPPLYQERNVRYLIQLSSEGRYLHIIDCATEKSKQGIAMFVPESKRSVNVKPFLLVDNAAYILGIARDPGKAARTQKLHAAFVALVQDCARATQEPVVRAVVHFLQHLDVATLDLPQDFDPSARLTFEVNDVRPIDLESVRNYWATVAAAGDVHQQMQCLVCGQMRPAVKRLPIAIRGIPGGQATGMALISANEDAFFSYGLSASLIAPTCEACGERFGNALNTLLKSQETHLRVSGLAYIFWAKKPLSFSLTSLLSQPATEDVHQVLQSVWKGREHPSQADLTPFYAACLAAYGPRVVVRDWIETTLESVQRHLARYFALQRMIDGQGNERWFSLWQLVNATVRRDSKEDAAPSVGQALLHLALFGGELPYYLLYQVIRRIRAEQEVQTVQAALIKMVLLSHQKQKHLNESENTMAELDPANDDLAYLCGRLLAVLEEVQYRAIGDVSAGVIERYYGTASTAPASVFGRLLRGAQTHLTKMRGDKSKHGIAYRLDLQIQEILEGFEPKGKKFPSTLDMIEQGAFAIGYFNQKTFNRQAARAGAERKQAKQLADLLVTENGTLAPESDTMTVPDETSKEGV